MTHVMTQSGRMVSLTNPSPDGITIDDIAHHLAKICRYGGALPLGVHYSVALHSYNGAKIALDYYKDKELALAFILHDAHEAYLGDTSSPLKGLLIGLRCIEKKFDRVIGQKFNVSFSDTRIKKIDRHMLGVEWYALMPEAEMYFNLIASEFPYCHIAKDYSPVCQMAMFMGLYRDLTA